MMTGSEPDDHELPGEMHMRAAASTYVVFIVIFGPMMILPLLVSGLHDVSAWKATALFGGLLAVFLSHFSCLEVRLSNGLKPYRKDDVRRLVNMPELKLKTTGRGA